MTMLTFVSSRRLQSAQNVSVTPTASVSQTSTQTQTQSQIQSQTAYVSISGCPSASYSPTTIQTPHAQPSTFSSSWTQSPTMSQSMTQTETHTQSQSPTTLTQTATATSTKSVSPPQQGATSIFTQYYTEIIVSSTVVGSLITFAIISNIWDCIKRKQKKAQDKKKALTEVIPNPTYNQNIRHSSVGNLIRSF